jgi:hypothetical protein
MDAENIKLAEKEELLATHYFWHHCICHPTVGIREKVFLPLLIMA